MFFCAKNKKITYKELEETSDNVIITTACLGGILNKGNDVIRNRFICFLSRNKHRCFLEIQHHNDSSGDQKEYNKGILSLWIRDFLLQLFRLIH